MPKITNLTNFTGTINGLVYYTVNGQQFIRAEKAKTNQTKSKELPKKLLPGIEALQISNALHSMNHLVNAMEKEFQTLKTPTRPQRKNDPAIKEFQGVSSGSGSTAATTAELEEKESARTDFHTDNGKSTVLENAIRDHTEIKFTVRGAKPGLHLIILQINFETGDFRRTKIALEEAHCIRKNTYTVETEYQARKGYTDLLFLYGGNFLKAVPIHDKKNRNS